jgi:hypothetical protein
MAVAEAESGAVMRCAMLRLIGGFSPILLGATIATAAVAGQTPVSAPQQVTAVGCVTRNGVVDVSRGTRLLNMEPDGLALTAARMTNLGGNRQSAVPGSAPDGHDTGTIPRQTIVGGRSGEPDTITLALTGDRVKALDSYVGRRVEVTGRIVNASASKTPVPPAQGTAGATRDAAPVPGVGTREERPAEGTAHPSTELQKLDVLSFRGITGPCS